MLMYIIMHIVISVIIALIAALLITKRVQESTLSIFVSLLAFNLMLPFIAYIVTLLLAPVISFVKNKTYIHDVQTFNKEEFLKSPYPQVERLFGEGAVVSLATDKDNHSSNKMRGVAFMAQNPTKENNKLIRGLLSDQDNEVRLYSFSLLNSKEEELNKRISQLLSDYEKCTQESQKSIIDTKLAFLYWQFIYSGLIEVENEYLMIEKVQHHVNKALQSKDVKERELLLSLLAKTHFKKHEYKKSSALFYEAVQEGLKKNTILPYLAEIAFIGRDFEEVKALMQEPAPEENLFLTNPLYVQWRKS